MTPSWWTCPCGTRNPRVKQKCSGEGCNRRRPKRRVPVHARTLRDDSYEVYVQVARDIHGVTDESCCCCGKPRSQHRRHDRDHGHNPDEASFGKPRGLLCPGDFGCNTLMPKKLTAELAKRSARLLAQPGSEVLAPFLPRDLSPSRAALVAAYLARVEDYYRNGAGALSGAYTAPQEASCTTRP